MVKYFERLVLPLFRFLHETQPSPVLWWEIISPSTHLLSDHFLWLQTRTFSCLLMVKDYGRWCLPLASVIPSHIRDQCILRCSWSSFIFLFGSAALNPHLFWSSDPRANSPLMTVNSTSWCWIHQQQHDRKPQPRCNWASESLQGPATCMGTPSCFRTASHWSVPKPLAPEILLPQPSK